MKPDVSLSSFNWKCLTWTALASSSLAWLAYLLEVMSQAICICNRNYIHIALCDTTTVTLLRPYCNCKVRNLAPVLTGLPGIPNSPFIPEGPYCPCTNNTSIMWQKQKHFYPFDRGGFFFCETFFVMTNSVRNGFSNKLWLPNIFEGCVYKHHSTFNSEFLMLAIIIIIFTFEPLTLYLVNFRGLYSMSFGNFYFLVF